MTEKSLLLSLDNIRRRALTLEQRDRRITKQRDDLKAENKYLRAKCAEYQKRIAELTAAAKKAVRP